MSPEIRRTGAISSSVAFFVVAVNVWELFRALQARHLVGFLDEESLDLGDQEGEFPLLSVVVAARDEELSLESAFDSMVSQSYPEEGPEIILVDDRSTDSTGEIMDRLAEGHPRRRVIHIHDLPEGWLGKNYAAYTGASRARGEWLLFTDADVHFGPEAFYRAVAYARREGLDHLTLVPELNLEGYWLQSYLAFCWVLLLIHSRRYQANIPASGVGAGIGAFNLIRREAYERIGTYAAIATEVVDDMSLGAAIKRADFNQRMLFGEGFVSVRWYHSLSDLLHGLEKNAFAILGYSLPRVVLYTGVQLGLLAWPFFGVFFFRSSRESFLYLCAAGANLATFVVANRHLGWRALYLAPPYPVNAVLSAYVLVRCTVVVLREGGVRWRGTFYPLGMLRRELHSKSSGMGSRARCPGRSLCSRDWVEWAVEAVHHPLPSRGGGKRG